MKDSTSLKDLKWIRVMTPMHIPKYLVEQVKDREFDVDRFYKYQEEACITKIDGGFRLNPYNHLWILVTKENITKGYTWFTIDILSESICIHTYSIDKEYWFQNKAVGKLVEFMRDFIKEAQMKHVYWISKYPKHQEKYGFRRSKHVLMEYTEEDNGKYNIDGGNEERRGHKPPESSTNAGADGTP